MPQKDNKAAAPARPFARKVEFALVAALLLAAVVWVLLSQNTKTGAIAQVNVTLGDKQQSITVPLDKDDTLHIDAGLPVTLEVKDNAIRFIHSQCQDHRCEAFGWLRHEGDWALCAPAGVMVSVREAE